MPKGHTCYGRQNNSPPKISILGTYYLTWQKELSDVIKLRLLCGKVILGYLGINMIIESNHKGLQNWRSFPGYSERDVAKGGRFEIYKVKRTQPAAIDFEHERRRNQELRMWEASRTWKT